jgi:hypothetical protein
VKPEERWRVNPKFPIPNVFVYGVERRKQRGRRRFNASEDAEEQRSQRTVSLDAGEAVNGDRRARRPR